MCPKFTNKVTSKNNLTNLMKKLKNLDGAEASAGFDDVDKHAESGTGMATIAYIHEHGTKHIPARPFMTQAAQHDRDHITLKDRADLIEKHLYDKKPLRPLLSKLSWRIADNIPYAITSGNYVVTNNPTPLLDTLEMVQSVRRWSKTGKDS